MCRNLAAASSAVKFVVGCCGRGNCVGAGAEYGRIGLTETLSVVDRGDGALPSLADRSLSDGFLGLFEALVKLTATS